MYDNKNMCMEWDDAIESDGQEFIILEEGDYNFRVVEFERGRFPGSAKIPPCNKAALTLQVKTADGKIAIEKLIPEGKKEMTAGDFIRGRRISDTDRFESIGD